VADTVTVLDEVCEGLAEMHGRDIVHRDLKTGNVALEEAPAARLHTKLLDLGSAKPAYEADPTGTKAWATMGSPPYLPPETAARGVASETGDIYGLGAIGYEMLCGIRAIHIRDTSPEAYSSYLRSTQPIPTYRIQTIQPDVPESIEAVIQRALSREPRERFPSVNAFRAALLQAAGRPAGPTGIAAPAAAPGKAEAGKPAPEPKKKTESLAFRTKESLRKLVPLNFGKR
jgi:serine/threonine-protein kinase